MRFEDVVARIRCPDCYGTGSIEETTSSCVTCRSSGINPEVVDEAGGWGTWAITVHDRPGPVIVVPLIPPATNGDR